MAVWCRTSILFSTPAYRKKRQNAPVSSTETFARENVWKVSNTNRFLLLCFASFCDTVSRADIFKLSSRQDFWKQTDSSKMFRKLLVVQIKSTTGYNQSLKEDKEGERKQPYVQLTGTCLFLYCNQKYHLLILFFGWLQRFIFDLTSLKKGLAIST